LIFFWDGGFFTLFFIFAIYVFISEFFLRRIGLGEATQTIALGIFHERIQRVFPVFLEIPNYFDTPLCIYVYILIYVYV
jgi:hypothetical protein